MPDKGETSGRRFRPKAAFLSPFIEMDKNYVVAVVPFFNSGLKKDAGDILLLHFAEELGRQTNFRVIEPGLVRHSMLNGRVIMDEGIALADADFILNQFNADFLISGEVVDYNDTVRTDAPPTVDFLVWAIQRLTKKVFWASESYNGGNDAVFMFDFGKVTTAGRLASKMVASVVKRLSGEEKPSLSDLSGPRVSPKGIAN